MGGRRRIVELLVVRFAAANDVVLVRLRQGGEVSEIVDPLLHRDKAGSGDTVTACRDKCGVSGLITDRVLGAVFVTGQVETEICVAVLESVDNLIDLKPVR
jgi:hypothetical protein